MRQSVLIVAAALLAGGLGLLAGGYLQRAAPSPAEEAMARIGEPAPDLALVDVDGRTRRLSEWQGRPRLLNFWASWCAPCVEEMPRLAAYAAAQGSQGTQVVGIALDERAAVQAFLARVPAGYPQLLEPAGRSDASVRYGNRRSVLPFSVLIGPDDRIRRIRVGAFPDAASLEEWARSD
jgi:thiol-disulfide isomerase/thioredoxin